MSSLLSLAGNAAPTGFYDFPIEQSLRTASGYLTRTFASAGDSKKMTISLWVKRANLDTGKQHFLLRSVVSTYDAFWIQTDYKLRLVLDSFSAYGITWDGLMRDTSSWYHICLAIDTSQSDPANRFRCFRNGEELTYTGTVPPQNYNLANFNKAVEHAISYEPNGGFIDGYIAEYNFIDGTAYDASYFGQMKSGIWIPKDPTGLTYGTNGFRLNFADTTTASGFNALTYSGDNLNPKSVNGCGFSPDFVWVKQRTNNGGGATFHQLYDSVRGTQKLLRSNTTDAELANPSNGGVQSFDADGFTIQGSSASLNMNGSGETYVAWCWDAGSGSPVSNTDGSITSTVKANTDYGFSIVSYTGNGTAGATVGHSLQTTPSMVIIKWRAGGSTQPWVVYHTSTGNSAFCTLNTTNPSSSLGGVGVLNNTTPNSSVITLGDYSGTNLSGATYIAYCFAEKTGFSKFGSYTGTGSSGLSVTGLGFKPAFLMVKSSTAAESWQILDNTREVAPDEKQDLLFANLANAEVAMSGNVEFTDDGFNVNTTIGNFNTSGQTYLFMAFADTRDAAFWRDVSGQGNDWQHNNLTFSDVVPDAPSNNFATINNLASLGGMTFSEGNTKVRHADIAAYNHARSTMGMTSGKWYWEWYNSGSSGDAPALLSGIVNDNVPVSTSNGYVGQNTNSYGWNGTSGERYYNATNIGTIAIPTGDSSGIYMVAYDADSGSLYFGKNGTWANSGNPATGTGALFTGIDTNTTWYPAGYTVNNDAGRWREVVVNHGQDSTFAGNKAAGGNADANGLGDFQYPVPSSFLSLCSANLPKGAIDTLADETPEDYFNTVLWTGDATNPRTLTGVGFEPSFSWLKSRSQAFSHRLYDAVRGAGNVLFSNATSAESSGDAGGELSAFTSDGFTTSGSSNNNNLNGSGYTYVGWNWKAGGAGVSNTDGSITSTVSVGATSQQNWFSVATYTGTGSNATVGHGLGVAPDMVIITGRNINYGGGIGGDWIVWHNALSATERLYLNYTNAKATGQTTTWNSTLPSSSVVSIGNNLHVNYNSSSTYVMYSFANAEGLCKVGSYTGNGSTDGSFIYTGHKPSFLLIKRTDAADNWDMHDSTRGPYNVNDWRLYANQSSAEASGGSFGADFLSNGFKLRTTNAGWNASGGSYIFLSIAEQPFKYANSR